MKLGGHQLAVKVLLGEAHRASAGEVAVADVGPAVGAADVVPLHAVVAAAPTGVDAVAHRVFLDFMVLQDLHCSFSSGWCG